MSIDVVYLGYYNQEAGYTLDTVKKFLQSYSNFKVGMEHSLKFIAKNWSEGLEYDEFKNLANEISAEIIELPDDGWDIGAYFRVVDYLDSDYVLFLGSSTEILTDNWLKKMCTPLLCGEIGLTGAMGSWEPGITDTFPNPHIRTCSFMLKRELFAEYKNLQVFPVTKEDTYNIEHGFTSITRFVLSKGLKIAVVDCDGKVFYPAQWCESKTFRHPEERRSIFSDNLSNAYYNFDIQTKCIVEKLAWGRSLTCSD